MSEPLFPYGYSRPPNGGPQGMGTMLTWAQYQTKKTFYLLHPEVQRRLGSLMHAAHAVGVPLGTGTGWRVQPNPPPKGFAKPGNSWHESCPVNPQSSTAFAIDTVPNVSWDWMEHHCGNFGFRTFRYVGQEPWHIQPTEIPASRKYATTPPPIYTWDLPSVPVITPPPVTPPTPPTTGGTFTLQVTKQEVTPARQAELRGNGDVFLIQQIAQGHFKQLGNPAYDCGKPDGDYGPRSQDAVRQMQRDGGLTVDAQVGPKTWNYILNSGGG